MSEKRKDNRGRILRAGESQRKDGTYMFRYSDIRKARRCVYAATLEELRAKEVSIQRDVNDGIDYTAGEITVIDLTKRYTSQKAGKENKTRQGYKFVINLLRQEDFGYRQIKTVKPSDCKDFFIKLHNDGRKYATILKVQSIVKPAFDMAVMDDILRKNPFSFPLRDVVPNDTVKKDALSGSDVEKLLSYVLEGTRSRNHYDEIMILLGTGLRASEFCGLVKEDIDFQKRRIRVERQLLRDEHGKYYISKPKTENGIRYIPMSDDVCKAFQNVILNRKRPKVEYIVDGCAGFLFLDRDGKPKTVRHLDNSFRFITNGYRRDYGIRLIVTPHILRHTFCTRLIHAGMDPKSVQYLMGHGDVGVTLGVYAHNSYETAEKAFMRVIANG